MLRKLNNHPSGQTLIEYAMIFILVLAGVMVLGPYVIRSWNAVVQGYDDSTQDSYSEPIESAPPGGLIIDCDCEWLPCDHPPCCGGSCERTEEAVVEYCTPLGCGGGVVCLPGNSECCTDYVPGDPAEDCGDGTTCEEGFIVATRICGDGSTQTGCIASNDCRNQCTDGNAPVDFSDFESDPSFYVGLCPGDNINLDDDTIYSTVPHSFCSPDGTNPKCQVECARGMFPDAANTICECPPCTMNGTCTWTFDGNQISGTNPLPICPAGTEGQDCVNGDPPCKRFSHFDPNTGLDVFDVIVCICPPGGSDEYVWCCSTAGETGNRCDLTLTGGRCNEGDTDDDPLGCSTPCGGGSCDDIRCICVPLDSGFALNPMTCDAPPPTPPGPCPDYPAVGDQALLRSGSDCGACPFGTSKRCNTTTPSECDEWCQPDPLWRNAYTWNTTAGGDSGDWECPGDQLLVDKTTGCIDQDRTINNEYPFCKGGYLIPSGDHSWAMKGIEGGLCPEPAGPEPCYATGNCEECCNDGNCDINNPALCGGCRGAGCGTCSVSYPDGDLGDVINRGCQEELNLWCRGTLECEINPSTGNGKWTPTGDCACES